MDRALVKRREQELRQACAKLEQGLRTDGATRAENYFRQYPLLMRHEDAALDLIYTEFITREELGQRPTPEEFYARFPQWKARLEQQFNIHEWLGDETADNSQGDSGPGKNGWGGSKTLQQLGQYEIREEIGRGRFGVVYKAWQRGLDRVVAVKTPSPHFELILESSQEFCHEARVMAGLQHPHIIAVHDIGEGEGLVYFSMDYAAGGSLAQRLEREGKLEVRDAATLVSKVAQALHYAHAKGVVHRDLKPSNILFDDGQRPLVCDFGMARMSQAGTKSKTKDRAIGTPSYMAPEQVASVASGRRGAPSPLTPLPPGGGEGNKEVTASVDIWALGVVLYETICGTRPFEKKSRAALFRAIGRDAPRDMKRSMPDVDRRLEAICLRCLAKEPEARYSSAGELADELRKWCEW